MLDVILPKIFLILNKLELELESQERLGALYGIEFGLILEDRFYIVRFAETIICEPSVDLAGQKTIIKLKLMALVALLLTQDLQLAAEYGFSFEDANLCLPRIHNFFMNLKIDWTEHLVPIFGVALAQHIYQAWLKIYESCNFTKNSFLDFLGEFIVEELSLSPNKYLINEFCDEVDKLKAHYERLERKIQHLKSNLC